MRSDWMPGARDDQLAMAQMWLGVLPEVEEAWRVPPGMLGLLAETAAEARAARLQWLGAGARRSDVARVRRAFAQMRACMRDIRRRVFYTPPLEKEDFTRLGLKPPDTILTRHFVVEETVEFSVSLRWIRELVIDFRVGGAGHKAKPRGYDGAVVVWHVGEAAPRNPADFARHAMASRTPYTLSFHEQERGRTVHIALAWQNARGVLGPYSDVASAIIP